MKKNTNPLKNFDPATMTDVVCPNCKEKVSPQDLEVYPKCPYCDYQFIPKTPWNYGFANGEFEVSYNTVDGTPFSESKPAVTIKANMMQIDWGLKFPYKSICRTTPKSRAPISGIQKIELYPYGCSRLRMTEMPLV